MTLSSATTPGQSEPARDGNKWVVSIPLSSIITGNSPSDCLVSLSGHSMGEGFSPLQRCSRCILHPQLTGQTFKEKKNSEFKSSLLHLKIDLVSHPGWA